MEEIMQMPFLIALHNYICEFHTEWQGHCMTIDHSEYSHTSKNKLIISAECVCEWPANIYSKL